MSSALDYSQIADLYDSFVRVETDVPFFVEEVKRAGGPVLELMCGTGRLSLPLLEAGADLTCVDVYGEMLDVLRQKIQQRGLAATLVQADVARMTFSPEFALALLPFQSFNELTDEADQRAALRGVCAALVPGGRFVCTLHNPPVRLRSVGQGAITLGPFPRLEGPGSVEVVLELGYEPAGRIVSGTETVRALDGEGQVVREHRLPLRFVLIEPEAFFAMAEEAGFEILEAFGDYARAPFVPESSPFAIVTARKHGS
jgi:SAM-dependent methyltransferase